MRVSGTWKNAASLLHHADHEIYYPIQMSPEMQDGTCLCGSLVLNDLRCVKNA